MATAVSSVEPSSTTMTSRGGAACPSTLAMASPTQRPASRTGTTQLALGTATVPSGAEHPTSAAAHDLPQVVVVAGPRQVPRVEPPEGDHRVDGGGRNAR